MSDDAPDVDGIEPGKRLVRVGGDKGLSLAERLAARWHRLSWRTPLHSIRLKGRYPLKLLAVPEDPILGNAKAGKALLGGTFLLRGERLALADLDFARLDASPSLAAYIHGFAWLRDLSTVATREQGAPIAEAVARKWIAAHAEHVSDFAWQPELWGKRILFWTAHAPLILNTQDLVYRSAVLNALARGARHLDRGADKSEPGLPRITAWIGLTAAGLLIPGSGARLAAAEAGLGRAFQSGLSPDGGVIDRAPSSQLELAMLLATLRAVYDVVRKPVPEAIEEAIGRAVPALLGVTHGDGGLASFQGSSPANADAVGAVVEATGIRTRPQRQPRDWGYHRLSGGKTNLIIDAAPPPVSRLAAGGCASTLAFELSDGPHRLVVNCGGSRESSAYIPSNLVLGLRSSAAHSTLIVADSNSTAIHADGTMGRGVSEITLDRKELDTGSRIEASHDGYARRYGFVHQRLLALTSDGKELRGEDALLPAERRKKPAGAAFAVRFHLGPNVEVSPTADGQGALMRVAGGALWQFRCRGGALAIEDSIWVDDEGRPRTTHQLAVSGESAPGGATVSWVFKRAG